MKSSHHAGFSIALPVLLAACLSQEACAPKTNYYKLVEDGLLAGNPEAADRIIEQAEDEYGSKSRVLYGMDRGMTLQLAGRYEASNGRLDKAEMEVERLYTRRVRTEVSAFLINDTQLPFEGAPYEQLLINVMKALNYALLQDWDEALVEARRIDHRLNVLADQVDDETAYRDDPFARYVTGILYEVTGDLNNAFIAYRNAYEGYQAARGWSRTPVPSMLRADLLRVTDALHLTQEHESYLQEFGRVPWRPWEEVRDLAQVVMISYNGSAPRLEDQFVDLPISKEALKLVLLTKAVQASGSNGDRRVAESVLYGLNGRVVRVALPKLVSQKTRVLHSRLVLTGSAASTEARTELASNLTANAQRALDDRFEAVALKAVARSATKFALAEGMQHGAGQAGGKDAGPLLALLVGILAKSVAVATEEADKRSWRTLPDEIHLARLWVAPGSYELRIRAVREGLGTSQEESVLAVTLSKGETRFFIERVLK